MSKPATTAFPIVGIGASAGGLEALEAFLRNVPSASGMAYVIVQHLDPTHVGMLAEILQRSTQMPVAQVTDGMQVAPDRVYVIPPNTDLSMLHGVLRLLPPSAPRGLRLPIDYFFKALAEDADSRSIGVILSGMGTDGTLGLKAIKGKAGGVFVQSPESAGFDSMPKSAIDAGLADVVAPAAALPLEILAYVQHTPSLVVGAELPVDTTNALAKVIVLLRSRSGHDFSLYKESTVRRRIERRMGIHHLPNVDAYVLFVQANPQELDLLFKELLISVTRFFRDPDVWQQLATDVLPDLIKRQPRDVPVRAWTAACATGEEAYSLAILFREAVTAIPGSTATLQIFATDLDSDAIDRARAGFYPLNIAAEVSASRLEQFFVPSDRGFQIGKVMRETIVFAPHNLVMDPPFTRLDIVTCRNLLIYLTPELQNKILPLFHYCLNPGGVLLLGNAESIGTATELFTAMPGNTHAFVRRDTPHRGEPLAFPAAFARAQKADPALARNTKVPDSLQTEAERFLLASCTPAAVLADEKGDILFINGRTGKYLEPAAGKTNWNVFAMVRDGLRQEFADAFRAALVQQQPVVRRNVHVTETDGAHTVDLTVQRLQAPEVLRGLVMVLFADSITIPPAPLLAGSGRRVTTKAHVVELEQQLSQARQALQSTRDETRTSQEDLNAVNEELQSTNEELQSTNEELTTSKEEMQSMNEELQSLNHELQAKIDDLSRVSNDMKNLLENTEIATVFLDSALNVRLFTAGSNRIFKLIPGDTGRPITDLASELAYPNFANDARQVLRTLVAHEQPATTRDGRWFLVRIMPYRTLENQVEGVAITFSDITASKQLEGQLRATQAGLEKHIEAQAQQIEEQQEDRRDGAQDATSATSPAAIAPTVGPPP